MKKMIAFILTAFAACTVFAGEGRTDSEAARRNSVLPPLQLEKYEYYEVCGCCEQDLKCEMSDKAIRWKDGNKYDSVTHWKVKWDYGYKRVAGACLADSFRVSVEITVQLPRWTCAAPAEKPLVGKWDDYIANLSRHEKGHCDKALEAAQDITRAVAEMAPAATCSELDRKVQNLSRTRLKQLDEEQDAFDTATGHGHAPGASFP